MGSSMAHATHFPQVSRDWASSFFSETAGSQKKIEKIQQQINQSENLNLLGGGFQTDTSTCLKRSDSQVKSPAAR